VWAAPGAGSAGEYVSLAPTMAPFSVRVLESTGSRTVLEYTVGGYERTPVEIDGETYYLIDLEREGKLLDAGSPELPRVGRSVIIPDAGAMTVRVVESSWVEQAGVRVAPSKGNLLRTVDPATVPYELGRVYGEGGVYPAEVAYGEEPYIMRDYRGMVVVVHPFRYDAGREVLRVCSRMVVEVVVSGRGGVNELTHRPSEVNAEFDRMYRGLFVNYEESRHRYTPVGESGELLVICYGPFMAAMEPLVEWKRQTGMPCTMVSVADAGGDTTGIKTYIQNYYNTRNLAYVLLVGDSGQCPTLLRPAASDPSYSLIAGSDNRPDIFVGRFSAESVAQVETQVLRTVEYEKTPQVGAAWYNRGTGIASNQGPGDDGEYDHEHIDNIRTRLLGFTYTAVDQIYDPGVTASMITAALNGGRSIINYAGHGATSGWSTGVFMTSHVMALQNDNMLPFIVSAACFNGQFTVPMCFGEAWLRSTRNGEPIGAIGAYMSSISQGWSPPMDAQDEITDLLIGTSVHGVKRTFGGLCFNGSNHMMDEYPDTGGKEFRNWNLFGDPSLKVRTDAPATLSVLHEDTVPADAVGFDVTVEGVAGALCALYGDGVIYGAAVTGASGNAVIPISLPLPAQADLTLTVTAFNAVPHVAEVHVGEIQTPVLSVAPASIVRWMEPDATGVDTLVLTNVGEPQSLLAFTVEMADRPTSRQEETCRLSIAPAAYEPGTTVECSLTVVNAGDGDAWVDGVTVRLPDGVTAVGWTDLATDGRTLGASGSGSQIAWAGDWWNAIYPGDTAHAAIALDVAGDFEGSLEVIYTFSMVDRRETRFSGLGTSSLAAPDGPTLTIVSPNGGEVWAAGGPHTIAWLSEGAGDSVALLWSQDGGERWHEITRATANDGSHVWTNGPTACGNCLVRVVAVNEPAVDTSDLAFTLIEPLAWLSAAPLSGSIAHGEALPVLLTFDTTGLRDGSYEGEIVIESSGGDAVIPVSLRVRPTGTDERVPSVPTLYGAFPNPFNPATRVAFSLPARQRATLRIYDPAGRLVRELADGVFDPGNQFIAWDGRAAGGTPAASGVYFCRLESAGTAASMKLLLLK